jgi:hypothetical protein
MITTIAVVCDDQGHARGKIAKIDTFARVGEAWVTAEQLGDRRPRDHGWRDHDRLDGARHRYECKLCRSSLVCSDDVLRLDQDIYPKNHKSDRVDAIHADCKI